MRACVRKDFVREFVSSAAISTVARHGECGMLAGIMPEAHDKWRALGIVRPVVLIPLN